MSFFTLSFMGAALQEAEKAQDRGEVPVGAIVVFQNKIIGKGHNLTRHLKDPTAHAEIIALKEASKRLGTPLLEGCDLYVTLEPCAMCAGALSLARMRHVFFGAYDPKGGSIDHGPRLFQQPTCLHRPQAWGGIDEKHCQKLLKDFFKQRRI
jgi:tRNA(Arg) A34 adenosine deaminase TadA